MKAWLFKTWCQAKLNEELNNLKTLMGKMEKARSLRPCDLLGRNCKEVKRGRTKFGQGPSTYSTPPIGFEHLRSKASEDKRASVAVRL